MLSALAHFYGLVTRARNAMYDRGILEVHDLGARVISVGNLTTGGTGKTPLVAYIAELLAASGEKVCILTRGYGRRDAKQRVLVSDGDNIFDDAARTGDEPLELAKRLRGKATVISDVDRTAAGEWAKRKFGVTAFVLDDGFQHRKLNRDVDIICIDATQAVAEAQMLPAGPLREPLRSLDRATAVVITRADLVDEKTISDLRSEIFELEPNIEIFEATTRIRETPDASQPMYAFCGLGNPENFFEMLRRNGLSPVGTRAFRDHHRYSQEDVKLLELDAKAKHAECLVTTSKDAVKLSDLNFDMPLTIVEIDVEIDDAGRFAELLG